MSHPEKYNSMIDTETWAFIRETESWYPPDAVNLTIERQREVYTQLCQAFSAGRPDGVSVNDGMLETTNHGIAFRRYVREGPAPAAEVVYYHGGGYVVGGLESHDDVCAEICAKSGFPVTSIDYRLAPEHRFPADFDDALAGFQHVAKQGTLPVIVCGDSAGGNLAAAVSHATRGNGPAPVGQVLIYPALDNDTRHGSYKDHAHAPMLTSEDMAYYNALRTGGNKSLAASVFCNPLTDTDFSDLPPTVVVSAECDPLRDDGENYCNAIRLAGGLSLFVEEAGLVHGYLRARHTVNRARLSFNRITAAISLLGSGRFPENA